MAALSLQFDLTARREKNLRVLQSVDENVLEIIEDYSHVAVYEFETSVGKWERLDVEGSLFITRSANAPFYSVIVLNKKGPSDFELDLSTIIKLSLQKPYIMLRCTAPEGFITFGIWAHNETELEAIHSIITRIAINKETPMAPQSPQAKASQLLSLLKGNNTACSTPCISPASATVVTASELKTSSSSSTGTSKSMVLLSALKGGGSGGSSTKSTSIVVNVNTETNNENNSNEHSSSGNSISKSAQLLSILKSPTSATKATAATCSNSNDNTKNSQINKKKEGYKESKSVPTTTAQTADEKRAELMMKLIKPRATTVEDLLTDVDIAAKVKAAEQVLVSSSSTVIEALPDSTSTSSLNVNSISVNSSSNSNNDRGSKQDALMRLMMRAVSVSPTTAPITTTAATAPSTNTGTTARVSPPTATSGLPPRPSDNINTTTGSGSGANGKSSPAVPFSQSGNSTQRSAEQLAAALRNSANSIRSLHRSPSASPILTGMAGPVPGQVTPVSWASLSNQSNSITGSNILHVSASTGNLSSTHSAVTGGTVASLRNSAGLTSSASSNNVLSASSGGSASSTAAATTVRTATPLLISPSDLRCRTSATTTASTR